MSKLSLYLITTVLIAIMLSLSGCGSSTPTTTNNNTTTKILLGGTIQGTPLNLSMIVTTLAGSGSAGAIDGTGIAATFQFPSGVTTDGANLYVTDSVNNKIRKIVIATGVVTTLAGSGVAGAADGTGVAATFWSPLGITTDGTNLYITDAGNNAIRKIVIATGVVTTLAGSGVAGAADGTGVAATFNWPCEVTTDGTNLYIADFGNHKIRKIVIATGIVTTIAGSGVAGAVDGTGIAATFKQPYGITTDGMNLYVADQGNKEIRKIVIATGVVTTLAGSGAPGAADGTGIAATFWGPAGITTDGINLYVVDTWNNNIRKIVIATGVVTTLAGSGVAGAADGTGIAATFNGPTGITTDGTNLYIVDKSNNKIRKIQ